MPIRPTLAFGTLLKQLRKRAGMPQRDLAAALGYSDSLISSLEKGQRLPDLAMVRAHFIPALGLQDEPVLAIELTEAAALARGQILPAVAEVVAAGQAPATSIGTTITHDLSALPTVGQGVKSFHVASSAATQLA